MKISDILDSTMTSLKDVIDTNNVVGKPIIIGEGSFIVPVSKVSFGFLTGAGEYSESSPKVKEDLPHAGGSGGGASISPIGFLVCMPCGQKFIKVDKSGDNNKWADLIQATMNVAKDLKK